MIAVALPVHSLALLGGERKLQVSRAMFSFPGSYVPPEKKKKNKKKRGGKGKGKGGGGGGSAKRQRGGGGGGSKGGGRGGGRGGGGGKGGSKGTTGQIRAIVDGARDEPARAAAEVGALLESQAAKREMLELDGGQLRGLLAHCVRAGCVAVAAAVARLAAHVAPPLPGPAAAQEVLLALPQRDDLTAALGADLVDALAVRPRAKPLPRPCP